MSRQAKFRMEALNAHNSYRRLHDVQELEYDVDLEASAQEYAEELADADDLRVSHGASLGIYGENISRRTSSSKAKPDITGAEVSSLWYRDIEKFNYATGTGRAGNFTQLVWRDTRQFGIGKAYATGRVVVVAHYGPAGNVRGQFLENVPPAVSASAAAATGGEAQHHHHHHHQHQRPASKETTGPDEMLNYRVKSRQVDMREMREGRAAVVVRREVVEYEDTKGRVKQKLVLERQPKSPGAEDNDSESSSDDTGSSRSGAHRHDAEVGSLSSQGSLEGTKDPMEVVAAGGSPRHDSPVSTVDDGSRPGLQSHIVRRNVSPYDGTNFLLL